MLIRTTDRYLNPWSSQRHATGQDLIDLSLALQSTDVAAQVMNTRVGLLDTRIDEIFRTLNLPGRYEDPSVETFQKKTVAFQDQDARENNDHVVDIHENQESYPLIQIHSDARDKEMHNVGVAFQILEKDEPVPIGWSKATGHMIFDVKMDFTRKAR